MLIYVLFGLVLFATVFIYVKWCKDVFAPPMLFLIAYVVSIGCAVVNVEPWHIDMAPVTFIVLLIGTIEFVVIGFLTMNACRKQREHRAKHLVSKKSSEDLSPIWVAWWKVVPVCITCLIYIVLLYTNILAIAAQQEQFNSLPQALMLFKRATSETLTTSLPWWLEQGERLEMICAYVFMYILIRNIVSRERPSRGNIIRLFLYAIPVLVYLVNGYLMSDRLIILQTIIAAIVMCFVLWSHKTGKLNISWKAIAILIFSAALGLAIFYLSAGLVGRINIKGPLEYITYYCGGSIECLNQFLKEPPAPSEIFGKETFYNLNRKLYDLGILSLDEFYPIHLEFRYYEGVSIGNVYTAYRRWIYDFGFLGAFLLQGMMASIMSWFYCKLKYRTVKNAGFWLILYSYLAYTVVLHPIDGYLYIQYISQTFLTTVLILAFVYWFIIVLDVRVERGLVIYLNRRWMLNNFRLMRR